MAELGSAPVPAPGDEDHRRGPAPGPDTPLIIVYADFECPYCAATELRLRELPLHAVFRHFPVRSSHPRAWPAACAAEAAASQGRFWEMHDALFDDQARLADPHLWARAHELGLDLERFDAERRDPATAERVKRDFRSGVRAGVVTTPTLFEWRDGAATRVDAAELMARLGGT
ncbi:MAG TPA: thioredoxin domain-containing protein [Solirubrobacteraceae bacterium]|jgi:protein-disulfide isomerase|nr:thioredoxin domain-containing protein [Solirubrobacteraceae bacterium]